jgi:hypothetical protein
MPHQRSFMMKRNKECAVSVAKKKDISIAVGAIPILPKQKKDRCLEAFGLKDDPGMIFN